MALCLGVLRWPPDAFWRATPREIAAALAAVTPQRPEPTGRAALETLIAAFPDAP